MLTEHIDVQRDVGEGARNDFVGGAAEGGGEMEVDSNECALRCVDAVVILGDRSEEGGLQFHGCGVVVL